jgi:hypothetical protein
MALPVIERLEGMRCVTPFPSHVSFAVMVAERVTIVPLGVPQGEGGAAVTVTVAEPLFVASSVLVAVIV